MTTPTCLSDFPGDLVRAVAADAAHDADRVGEFLAILGLHGTPERPLALPAGFLLDLGAALRLLAWEQAGLQPPAAAGLPSAQQALRNVARAWLRSPTETEAAAASGSLAYRVCQTFAEHFAWSASAELDADVMLDEADEEAVLEALADFLWTHRQR